MYLQDSFFDLSSWGRIGLVCISSILFLSVLFATRTLLKYKPVLVKLTGSLVFFWLFVWLSPQVYYMYYRILIPSLPLQWVIWPMESPITAFKYLLFQGPQNLSAHSQGLLGWSLIVAPFVRGIKLNQT